MLLVHRMLHLCDMPFSVDTLASRRVLDCTSAEVTTAFNRSFEQYIVPLQFDQPAFERRFRGEHLDPVASRVWYCGEELVGVVLIARRGWTSRVAGMGLVVPARGMGLGKPMLQTAIDEARLRGDRLLMLEVFTNNPPAIRLYERLGFRITRTLSGYSRAATTAAPAGADALVEVDPLTVARLVIQEGEEQLPWMIAGETLVATAAPIVKAWRLGQEAYALVRPEAEKVVLLSLVVPRVRRRQGWGRRMVRALEAQYAGQLLLIPCLLPPGAGQDLLRSCGWELMGLELHEMEVSLG
jgi:ribosomal protein S18 acetylase RimI-like enzyme